MTAYKNWLFVSSLRGSFDNSYLAYSPPPPHPTPAVAMPASNMARESLPSSCQDCPTISRHLAIVLTEFDLLKTQTSAMQQDLASVKDILNLRLANPPPGPSRPEQVPPSSPLPNQAASNTQTSARPKTSRHTQTQPPPPPPTHTKPTSRPIRPLFPPPCPWQSGSFPTGPVRHLQPARSRSRPNKPRVSPTPTPSPRPSQSSSLPPETPPTADFSYNQDHADPPSSRPATSSTFQQEDSGSPLITEILDDDDDADPTIPPQQPAPPGAPADTNSLNF